MAGLLNTSKVLEHHLYAYRPLFLNGSKDARSCYRLIEEIFAESAKQSTITPELEKAHLAKMLGVTERTVERATKKLVSENRIFYEHTSKGKGKYSIAFQEAMQLPNDCLLDTKISEISSVVSNLARYNQPSKQPEKIQIADIEALIASSSFSIAPNSSKNEVQEASVLEAPTANSIQTITHQHNVKEADSKNFPISVEAVANTKKTNSPTLFYGEKEIESMIGNLTEDEQDSLIEEISSLVDDWTNTTDLQLKKDLVAEYKKSQQEISNNWYENWLWDKAQVEVYRKYVIEFMEGRGYIYKAEADLLENQQTAIVEVEVKPVLEANVSTSNHNNNNFELLGDTANKVLSASTITNTDQNVAIPIQAIQESGDGNVASASQENVTITPDTATNESPVNNVANLTQNSTDQNVAVSVTTTESLFANRLPALEIGNLRQECRRFSNFSSCPGAITTNTSLLAHTHAYTRMREVKVNKVYLNINYINFLTSTFLKSGSVSISSTDNRHSTSNTGIVDTTTNSTSNSSTITNNQTQNTIAFNLPNTLDTVTIANTTDTPIASVTEDAISNLEKGETIADNNTSNNTSEHKKQHSPLKVVTPAKQTGKKAKKAKTEVEEPTPEMIQRLESDRVSPKDFSLWKIVDKDFKIEQDSNGNYLLPNDLNNYPFSKYSFWDILAYAQTQGSIKKPASFSVSSYYSGSIETYATFHKYLKEKATSSIGKARKPTEPTPQEKLASEKAKEELEQQLRLESLKETRWNSLSTDEQQSLLIQEIETLKADKTFTPYYQKWSKDNMAILQDYATNRIKTKLAEKELVKATELTAINQQANS